MRKAALFVMILSLALCVAAFSAVRAEAAHQRCENQIQQAGSGDAHTSVGEKRGFAIRRDGGIAGQIRERAAQEGRNLALREEMEEQRAQTCEQQRR